MIKIKNLTGKTLGYGTCPNCGDSWWWKESGSITYTSRELGEGEDYTMKEKGAKNILIKAIKSSSGVMICKECLAKPAGLDEEKIAQDLIDSEWSLENVKLVKQAIIRYKQEKSN